MFRTSILHQLGGFNEIVSPADDLELCLRIARNGVVTHHGQIVLEYRCHPGNMTLNRRVFFDATTKVLNAERHALSRPEHRAALEDGIRIAQTYWLGG